MADLEKLFEQPDLSTDIKDNGRVNISLLSLNKNSLDLLDEIAVYLRTLPPFQHEDKSSSMYLRVLQSIPFWARERTNESEGVHLLNGSNKIYCLVCIAQCKDINDLMDASSTYSDLLDHFSNSLMATRCLIFGSADTLADELKGKSGFVLINTSAINSGDEDASSNTRSQVLSAVKHCVTVVYSSITILSASKSTLKKAGSLPHSMESTLDEDDIKHEHGICFKERGDHYLLLGEHNKAIEMYKDAHTMLPPKDYLWLGAVIEGILAAGLFIEESSADFHPISFELSCVDNSIGNRRDSGADTPSDPSPSSVEHFPINDKVIRENSLDGGPGDIAYIDGPSIARGERKMEKTFNQAIHYYNKAGPTGKKPLFELHLKYAGYLVRQEDHVGACKQLSDAQTVLSSEEELFAPIKVSLYLTLGKLYHTMGLKRKAIFMLLNAGRQAVIMSEYPSKILSKSSPKNPSDSSSKNWSNNLAPQINGNLKEKGYNILTLCLREFGIVSSEKKDHLPVEIKGWPLLQAMILTEYVQLCLKLEYYDTLIRWAWLCLQTFHSYLSRDQVKSLTENISESVEALKKRPAVPADTPEDEIVSSSFPVLSVPQISVMRPQPLDPQLSVKQSKTLFSSLLVSNQEEGPFLYSAASKRKARQEVHWVQGDPAKVLLVLRNPLPVETKVEMMMLILEGPKVEVHPSTTTLHPCSDSHQIDLLCIPAEPGHLSLKGYSATMFNLQSTTNVTIATGIKVLPSLPQLNARLVPKCVVSTASSSSHSSYQPTSSAALPSSPIKMAARHQSLSSLENIELLDGEVCECKLQLESIGDFSVKVIKISVKESDSGYCTASWDDHALKSLLPMCVKNEKLYMDLTLSVNIPSSVRVGPCKPDESHVQSCLLRRNSQPRNQKMATDRKVKTLDLPSPARRLGGSDLKELKEKSPSPVGSPSRLNRFTGSLRNKKPGVGNLKQHVDDSNLLNYLDLPKAPLSQEKGVSEECTSKPSMQSRHKQRLKDTGASGSQKGSVKRKSSSSSKNRPMPIVENTQPTFAEPSVAVPCPPQGTRNPGKDFRLVDYLNLDCSSADDLQAPGLTLNKRSDSTVSDNATDTSSDIVDFDRLSGDRVSITSDPGLAFTLPRISTSPTSISVRSIVGGSTSGRDGRKPASTDDNTKWHFGPKSYKKRPVTEQISTPTFSKQTSSGNLQSQHVTRSVIDVKKGALQKKTVKMTFLLQYTGGEGAKEGYYREVTIDVMISVKPTLYFKDFSVVPVKGSANEFSFSFMIENVTYDKLEIMFDVKQDPPTFKQEELDVQTSKEVSIMMKRFTLEDQEATLDEASILKPYCDHLVSLLGIKWSTPDKDRTGILSLTGLKLPQSVVASIRPLPVIFNYRTEAMKFSPGLPITIHIEITNNSGATLPPCAITLRPFTICPDGSKLECAKNKTILYSQSLAQWLPEMSTDFTYKLSMNMVFLCQDKYFIDVKLHKRKEEPVDKKMSTSDPEDMVLPSSTYTPKSTASSGSYVITSAIVPKSKTTYSTCKSKCEHLPASSKLGNITDFISQSKAYAGPQLCIDIH